MIHIPCPNCGNVKGLMFIDGRPYKTGETRDALCRRCRAGFSIKIEAVKKDVAGEKPATIEKIETKEVVEGEENPGGEQKNDDLEDGLPGFDMRQMDIE